jgi:hypothetical protein
MEQLLWYFLRLGERIRVGRFPPPSRPAQIFQNLHYAAFLTAPRRRARKDIRNRGAVKRIRVSDKVFAAIWALARPEFTTENDILEHLLNALKLNRTRKTRPGNESSDTLPDHWQTH